MPSAKAKLVDIKQKDTVFIVSYQIEAEGFKFNKAFRIKLGQGGIKVKLIKQKLAEAIAEEVMIKKNIKKLEKMGEFKVGYESKNKKS